MPAAVVVGLKLTGLGIVRSLSRSLPTSVEIVGVDDCLDRPTARTRLCRKVEVRCLTDDRLIDDLLRLADRFERPPVLFLSQDLSVLLLSAHRQRLAAAYRFLLPDADTTRMLMDKTRFAEFAEIHGFAIPRTVQVNGESDIDRTARELTFPCVIKPCYRTAEWRKRGYPKGFVVDDAAALRRAYSHTSAAQSSFVVQEWIPGDDSHIYFCFVFFDERSQCRGAFTGRKLRQWPGGTGNTAMAEPAHIDEVSRETIRLFASVGFKGFGSVEFKYDERDETYKIMEPTVGRANLQSEVATANGVNLPSVAYRYLADGSTETSRSSVRPVRWVDEVADLRRFLSERRTPSEVLDWLASYRPRVYTALFQLNDPAPFLLTAARLAWKATGRLTGSRQAGPEDNV